MAGVSPLNDEGYFFGRLAAWVNAEAATLFCAGVDLGLDRILLALEATDGDVFSLLLFDDFMKLFPSKKLEDKA